MNKFIKLSFFYKKIKWIIKENKKIRMVRWTISISLDQIAIRFSQKSCNQSDNFYVEINILVIKD